RRLAATHGGCASPGPRRSGPSGPSRLFQPASAVTPVVSSRRSRSMSQGGGSEDAAALLTLTAVRNERQFYYDKLRHIETLVAPLTDNTNATSEAKSLACKVLEILYAAD
ncbi:hypothetical protein DQ04_10981030, partial [Trypanosoma grayi]|uniref:hypothetical protein n=1 Tax=Trypanosoma grayi TaxID=71804 RepID=UPI0004F435C3